MPNGTYGGVRGRKTKVGRKLLRFPPTRLYYLDFSSGRSSVGPCLMSLKVFHVDAELFPVGNPVFGRSLAIPGNRYCQLFSRTPDFYVERLF